ncbi:origin recognition complex subunit 3 isoform X2 [Ambystoma mexicanum]|uniref:origin recognition complex subunit 3 isoform X2 n=1 Tax=Ambystoma mexicanum TaxID=8296 RepID=UPI0037E97300
MNAWSGSREKATDIKRLSGTIAGDMTSSTSSVSKGCFVFKPSSKKKRSTFITDYFNKGQDKDSDNSRTRFETYQELWLKMKKETEQLQEDMNKKLFDGLIEFFRQSHSGFQEKTNEWSCRMRANEIPTAALVLGVNVTDHDVTFKSLTDVLQESVTPYVASLHSKECPGIGQMVQKLLIQLMGQSADLEYDEEDEDRVQVTHRRTYCSMASLSGWYQTVTKKEKSSTPGKKRTSSSSKYWQSPPVVVIIKDLESFTAKVLQDFITIISQYIQVLPLILVFGIATSPMIIHGLLSHSVCSLLCIELFQSLSCMEHLSTVIEKLLLTTQFPFKLSGKVLQVLISIFLYHDFSVHNFIKGLQLSLVEHFHSQPLSVLCCSASKVEARVKALSHAECESLRQLPSFMRYVESQVPEKQIQLLTNNSSVKEVTETLLEDLHVYHKNYIPVLRCLHSFTSILPKYPLGKQIRELFCSCLEKCIWEAEEYASAFQLLRMLAREELVSALVKCVAFLKGSSGEELDEAAEKLQEFLDAFQSHEESGQVDRTGNVDEEEISPQKSLRKTDLYHLQKTLLELKDSRRSKKLSRFEVLRHEIVDFIDDLVRKYLMPPEMQTLHEVMYFGAAVTLRRHLNAAPRIALHTALNNPYCYLKNEALKSEAGSISNSAPDICIAYKLHLECGRLINLYDWLEAFATVVCAADGKEHEFEPLEQVDEIIHARFIRAVSEMELLGFVKATKQKTDHVARLTWGGC